MFSIGLPESPFFVVAAGRPPFWGAATAPAASPIHLAFRASSPEALDRFHAAGLRCGATNNGGPGVRRGRYYCAFLIDLDGNNIEAGYMRNLLKTFWMLNKTIHATCEDTGA